MVKSSTPSSFKLGYRGTPEERFERKFSKESNGCWIWTAARSQDNYGHFFFEGKILKSHKVSFLLYRGRVPKGKCVLHICDNSLCVNPNHLYIGTQIDNIADRERRGRSKFAVGEKAGLAKLTWTAVSEIRNLYKQMNLNRKELSLRYGVNQSTIGNIINNRTWVI